MDDKKTENVSQPKTPTKRQYNNKKCAHKEINNMPSVRPRLVEEGVPIAAGPVDANHNGGDAAMMESDNRFVVGGGTQQPPNSASGIDLSSKRNTSSLMNASSSSLAKDVKIRSSSLAKACKGGLSSAVSARKGNAKSVTQTSYVVGGIVDEKKSADSPYCGESNSMVVDDPSHIHRTSVTETSFQIPGGSSNKHNVHVHDDNESPSIMHIDPPPSVATSYFVPPASNAQPSPYDVQYQLQSAPTVQHQYNNVTIVAAPQNDGVEKMEGVIDLSIKPPMCVLDGANIAYAYSKISQGDTSLQSSINTGKTEPDARGIVVACNYFVSAGIRVLAVVPSTWTHREPHQSILHELNQRGFLVPAPPRDDDDAYALTIARREDNRAQQRGDGPGYVISNDMFRDAIAREEAEGNTNQLRVWLNDGRTLPQGKTGPGRISFAFCDAGAFLQGRRAVDL